MNTHYALCNSCQSFIDIQHDLLSTDNEGNYICADCNPNVAMIGDVR